MCGSDNEFNLQEFVGKEVAFFLEDDMFELTGIIRKDNGKFIIEITDAISHILKMIGKVLEVKVSNQKIYLIKIDSNQEFEMCINRIYSTLTDPSLAEFSDMALKGVREFFRKSDNTYVSYIEDTNKWNIDFYYYDPPRVASTSHDTLADLYAENAEQMRGKWEAICYSCAWAPN